MAEPLPHVVQPLHLPADGIVGQALAAATLQVRLQESDRPIRPGVAQLVWALVEGGHQQRLEFLGPHAGTTPAVVVAEGCRGASGLIEARPIVDRLPRHAEALGHLGNRVAFV